MLRRPERRPTCLNPGGAARVGVRGACGAWLLLAVALVAPCAALAPTNWASTALGATATANSAGYWAGYTALPEYALDGDLLSYWSSTGGAVCCSESAPGWLLVSLGAPRAFEALEVIFRQDMTFTLSLGNASSGPFAEVVRRPCTRCVVNEDVDAWDVPFHTSAGLTVLQQREMYALPAGVATATHVRLQVTWSSQGGIGGCNNLCDWATNVFELRAWSSTPPAPPPAPPTLMQPAPPPPSECTPALMTTTSVLWRAGAADATLTGAAALGAPDGGAHGSARLDLTPAHEQRFGAAEFPRIIHPATDCVCPDARYLLLTIYVWLGDGIMPGEGLVVSMVDATRQTPGATMYMPGCGSRAALPAHAVSIVFDTADSDASCDEPGTGVRLVSTLAGMDAAPQVLSATLDMSVGSFRRAEWVPLQFVVVNADATAGFVEGDLALAGQQGSVWAPYFTRVNGTEAVRMGTGAVVAGDQNGSDTRLSSFFIVASARTGARASDAHAVSGLRLECGVWYPAGGDAATKNQLFENWDGMWQPLTPPPRAPPPQPPRAQPHVRAAAVTGGAAFVASFVATGALLTGAAGTWHTLRRRRMKQQGMADADRTPLIADAGSAADDGFDVFLSYHGRADWRVVDAVHDKLSLCGLRAFKNLDGVTRDGSFSAELLRVMQSAAVFAPVITLQSLQSLAAEPAEPDALLFEWLMALHFLHAAEPRGVRLIHPLLVGAEATHDAARSRWLSLLEDPACTAALAALPDAVPSTTAALVDATLRRACGCALPPRLASLTVRQIVLGRAADAEGGAVRGVLGGEPYALACMEDDFGLYIKHRYAAPILALLRRGDA